MITSPEKENFSVPITSQLLEEPDTTIPVIETINNTSANSTSIMASKTIDEISHRVEEVFAKLQRNLEHNTRVFQEKSQGLLERIDQAEDQIRKVLAQLESAATGGTKLEEKGGSAVQETMTVVPATESIALSDETTKLEADETTEN